MAFSAISLSAGVCFTLLFTFAGADVDTRTLRITPYPDCDKFQSCEDARNQSFSDSGFPNLVYVTASGNTDTLHFVLTTVKVPGLVIVKTSQDGHMNFDWDAILLADNVTSMAHAINVSADTVQYSYSVLFTRLIEYNDTRDVANLVQANEPSTKTQWKLHDFTEFKWMNVTMGQGGNSIIFNTTFHDINETDATGNLTGSLYFEFEMHGEGGRDEDLPHLIYNANMTQMNFVLDKYTPAFAQSRYALEVAVISLSDQSSDNMDIAETKSIDDEYSPGVFKIVNWYSRQSHQDAGGYLQWKPVCYLDAHRARDKGTEVQYYDLTDTQHISEILNTSLAFAYFGNDLYTNKNIVHKASNISFGLSNDGFYVGSNYTAWTASIGYGTPPAETISAMVIGIIAAGLGIPVVIIIIGGLYVCIRKRKSQSYEELNGRSSSYTSVNS